MGKVVLNSIDYFGLVIFSGNKAIFVRENKDSLFHFPGSRISSTKDIKNKLACLLSRKYEGRVEIKKILEPVYAYSSKNRTSLSIVLAKEISPLRFPSSFEVKFLSGLDKGLIDPLDYKGLEKALIYSCKKKTSIGLDEYQELLELTKAIDFYSKDIDKSLLKEFKDFVEEKNNLEYSIKAFLFLLRENNLNKEDYLSYLKRKRK